MLQVACYKIMSEVDTQEEQQAMTLRQEIVRMKREEEKKKKAKLEKKTAPAREWSKGALRWAWGMVFSVLGFVPGLMYINIHAFFRITPLSFFFCELGTEWTPGKTEEFAEGFGLGGIKIGEKMLLAFLDLLLIITVGPIIILIIEVVS